VLNGAEKQLLANEISLISQLFLLDRTGIKLKAINYFIYFFLLMNLKAVFVSCKRILITRA